MVKRRIVLVAEPDLKRVADVGDELMDGVWVSVDITKSATISSLFTQLWQEEKCLECLRNCSVECVNFILKARRLNPDSSAFDLILDGDEISIRYRAEAQTTSPTHRLTSRKRKRSEISKSSDKRHRESHHKKRSPERIARELMKVIQPGYLVKVVNMINDTPVVSERSSERKFMVHTGKVVRIVASDDTFYLVLKKRETNVTLTLDVQSIRQVHTLQGTRESKVYESDVPFHPAKVEKPKVHEHTYIDIPLRTFPHTSEGLAHRAIGAIAIPEAIWHSKDVNRLNEWLTSEIERVKRRIKRQMEYYFSDRNWENDRYLNTLHKRYPEGIPLDKIAHFNCIRDLTTDLQIIREACSGSAANFQLIEDRVRRREAQPLPVEVKQMVPAALIEREVTSSESTPIVPQVATVEENSPASAEVILKVEEPLPTSINSNSSGNSGLAAFLQYVNEMGATWAQRPTEVPIKCEQETSVPNSERPTSSDDAAPAPAPLAQPVAIAKRFSNPLLD